MLTRLSCTIATVLLLVLAMSCLALACECPEQDSKSQGRFRRTMVLHRIERGRLSKFRQYYAGELFDSRRNLLICMFDYSGSFRDSSLSSNVRRYRTYREYLPHGNAQVNRHTWQNDAQLKTLGPKALRLARSLFLISEIEELRFSAGNNVFIWIPESVSWSKLNPLVKQVMAEILIDGKTISRTRAVTRRGR